MTGARRSSLVARSRKFFIKVFLVSFAFCVLRSALLLWALDLGFAKQDGGQPGAYLSFGAGARSLGMGRAYTAVAEDASASYWNPAGLAGIQRPEIVTLYALLFEKTGYGFLSAAYPTERWGTFALGAANLTSTDFDKRDDNAFDLGSFSNSETAAFVSYGLALPYHFSVGSTVKIANQKIDSESGSGVGADLGMMLRPWPFLTLGANIQNIFGPKIRLLSETDRFPLTTRVGAAVRTWQNKLLFSTDIDKTQNRSAKVHVGAEYSPVNMLAIRAGLDETEITAGMGFRIMDLSVDYAFAFQDAARGLPDLGMSHRFGFTAKFGTAVRNEKKEEVKIVPTVDPHKPWETVAPGAPVAQLSSNEAFQQMEKSQSGKDYLKLLDSYSQQEGASSQPEFQQLLVSVEKGIVQGIFPEGRDLYKAQGYLYYYQGNLAQAISQWQQVLDLDLLDQATRQNLKRAQAQLDQEILDRLKAPAAEELPSVDNSIILAPPAIPSPTTMLMVDPQKAEEHYNAGLDYYAKGDLAQAIAEWKQTLQYDPDHEGAKSALRHAAEGGENY